MSNTNYVPGLGNIPFGNTNTNPQSSQYATISAYSPTESILIAKAIKRAIFDAAPAQYNALKLLYEKPFEEVNNDEFEYVENTFGRSALVANAIVGAQAASPGSQVQQTPVTFLASSMLHLSPDVVVLYPDGLSRGVISAILSGTTVTINSQTSAGLPAIAVGDVFAVQSTIMADAMTYFSNYERMETVTRYNFVQWFLRAARWGRIELQKHTNSGTTDYLVVDKEQKLKQLRVDLFNAFFNGKKGEYQISSGYIAKAMDGIVPTMLAAGAMTANPTLAGLKSAFETLAFATNYKVEGAVRFIYGTDEILYELGKVWKEPGIRYAPSDSIANLNLTEYKLGTMRFVPVNCELFRESSCFTADWKRKLLIIDQETITPIKMKGIPQLEMGSTLDKGDNGTREGFKDWWVQAQLSLQMNNPLSSFIIDVQ